MRRLVVGTTGLALAATIISTAYAAGLSTPDAAGLGAEFTAAGYQVQIGSPASARPGMPASARQALVHQPIETLIITPQSSFALSQKLQQQLTALDGQIATGPAPETSQQAQQVAELIAQINANALQKVGGAIFRSRGDVNRYIDQEGTITQLPAVPAALRRPGDPTGSAILMHTIVGRVVYSIDVPTNAAAPGAQAARLLYTKIIAIARG